MSHSITISQSSQIKQVITSIIAVIKELLENGLVEVIVKNASQKRREIQNRLAFHWYEEAEQQTDHSRAYWRAYCKLHHGVAIAKEDEVFEVQYDVVIKPHSYERKMKMMLPPFELPVTSILGVKQMTRYLKEVQIDLAEQGIILTTSDDMYFKAMGEQQ